MELRDAATILGVVISAQSLFLAIIVAWLNDFNAKRTGRLSMLAYTDAVDSTLRTWGIDVVKVLDEAIALCKLDPVRVQGEPFFDRSLRVSRDLSSHADIGRWFFRNKIAEGSWEPKEVAYRGLRPQVLDAIVAAYGIVESLDYKTTAGHEAARNLLVAAKKSFVSALQEALNPRKRRAAREAVLGIKRVADVTSEKIVNP